MAVEVTRDGLVLTVTLVKPARKNAIDPDMFDALLAAFTGADADPDVRVVVVTGADGDFSSGADLLGRSPATDGRADGTADHPLTAMDRVNRAASALHRLGKPVIAKVDGVAVGAGMNLALGCDLVVASERARFSEIFPRRGLSVDFGGSWILPRRIGLHRAKELCLLGDVIDAKQAAELGLVNRVVPVEQLDATVDALAARLAAGPPVALAQTKRLLDASFSASFEEALDEEGRAQAVNLMGADAAEAFRAFAEKREPRFTGRPLR
ncbi:MAG: enoyl-CoA hydratase/isomerase family protein [Pseudonocardia sp.]